MSDAPRPGWYSDPSGDRFRLRWWDGVAWTGIVRDRAAFEQPGMADAPGPLPGTAPRSPARQPDVLEAAPPVPQRPRWLWPVVVVAVGLIGVLVLTGSFPGLDPAPRARPDSAGGPSAPDDPTTSQGLPRPNPSPRLVQGRVTDRDAGISYDVLPGDWREWDQTVFRGFVSTVGYYRVVQERTPGGGIYWANVNSGPVNPAASTPNDLRSTAGKVVGLLAPEYYPKHTRRELTQRPVTVDGRPGYLIRYVAAFDRAAAVGYSAQSELVAILVVDTGRPRPAVLYVSLPDTVRPVWSSLDALIRSVRVLR